MSTRRPTVMSAKPALKPDYPTAANGFKQQTRSVDSAATKGAKVTICAYCQLPGRGRTVAVRRGNGRLNQGMVYE